MEIMNLYVTKTQSIMKKTNLNSWVAIVLGSVALFTTYSCTDDDLANDTL